MKKTKILSLVLALILVLPTFVFQAGAQKYKYGSVEDVDQLVWKTAYLTTYLVDQQPITTLNDFYITGTDTDIAYNDYAVCAEEDLLAIDSAEGKFQFLLTDGSYKNYYYFYEYKGLNMSCSSFEMFHQIGKNGLSEQYCDSEIDILVSTDKGKTYSVAWSSVPYVYDDCASDAVSIFGRIYQSGGNNQQSISIENTEMRYLKCYETFNDRYEGVTNIIYACSKLRRVITKPQAGVYDYSVPNIKIGQLSEFRVFDSNITPVKPLKISLDGAKDVYAAGETATFTIDISDNPGFTDLHLYIDVPENLSVSSVALRKNSMLNASGRISETNYKYNRIFLDFTSDSVCTVNSTIARITVVANSELTAEQMNGLHLRCAGLRYQSLYLKYTISDTVATISKNPAGDANADGVTDINDLVCLRKYLLSYNSTTKMYSEQISQAVDMNYDGSVNLKDLVILIKKLAG